MNDTLPHLAETSKQRPRALFFTNVPSFYKTGLLDHLVRIGYEFKSILISARSLIRSDDFFSFSAHVPSICLSSKPLERASPFFCALATVRALLREKPQYLFLCGWDRLEFWTAAFTPLAAKRIFVLESSILEHKPAALKDALKRLFLSRIHACVATGALHKELLTRLSFTRPIFVANGVGVLELPRPPASRRTRTRFNTLLYLGRLSWEKNLLPLIEAVRQCPTVNLIIAGDGPCRSAVESAVGSCDRVSIIGAVGRGELPKVFDRADALILPSTSETWGLVLEEAVHFGLPVLLSKRVASWPFFTVENRYGIAFDPDVEGMTQALQKLQDPAVFQQLLDNVHQFQLARKNRDYAQAFVQALETA